jgi:DNA replication protein DnaC
MSSTPSSGKKPCPECNDTGWTTVAGGGRHAPVVRCACQEVSRAERLLKAAQIPKRYEHCVFNEFIVTDNVSLFKAKTVAQRFVERYELGDSNLGLLFVGNPGTGKTHLAVSILKELIRRKQVECLFVDYRELLKSIQHSYNPEVAVTEMDLLRPVAEAEVLVLDELGAVRTSEWVWDTVSVILNARYNESRTTIITTNYPDLPERDMRGTDDLRNPIAARKAMEKPTLGDRITDRMRSRLHEMCEKVVFEAEDHRAMLAKNRPFGYSDREGGEPEENAEPTSESKNELTRPGEVSERGWTRIRVKRSDWFNSPGGS